VFSGDVLVLNDTRVIPARLFGLDEAGRRTEFLLVTRISAAEREAVWDLPGKTRPPGEGRPAVRPWWGSQRKRSRKDREWSVQDRFFRRSRRRPPPATGDATPPSVHSPALKAWPMKRTGRTIRRFFAREDGAIAAPTAGLHMTETLLEALRAKGVQIVFLTLHVGPRDVQARQGGRRGGSTAWISNPEKS